MSNVVIIFDEISLVLSKNDYVQITKFNKQVGDYTYLFIEDELCFICFDKVSPLVVVFFTPVNLEGRDCYEISQIKHKLDSTPNLPADFEEFNHVVSDIIDHVFHLLNDIIVSNDIPKQEMGYRYYLRKKKTRTYDIRVFFDRVNIREFIQNLSWVFGVNA